MFDHRLGLALGKSIGEVRRLPYPEYHDWELFYMLEPWGWHNEEYLMSMIVAMVHNIQVKPKSQRKQSYFIRDMKKLISEKINSTPDTSEMTFEERREFTKNQVIRDFGIDNSRNHIRKVNSRK
jgi:hypothetical protein